MRWTREAAYAQQDEVHFDHALGKLLRSFYTDTQAAADSSQWSKTFDSRGIGTDFMHHGEISPPGPANTLAPYERRADSHAASVVHQMYVTVHGLMLSREGVGRPWKCASIASARNS
jgi:hypothetical protein